MWGYSGSAQAFAFHGRFAAKDRKRLLQALDSMARHPPAGIPSEFKDDAGRELRIWREAGFEFWFWLDHAAREVRIVEIDWARE